MLVTWILKFTEFYLFTEAEGQDKVPSKIPRQRFVRSEGFLFQIKTQRQEKILYKTTPWSKAQDDVGQTLLANVYVERCSFLTPEMKVLRLGPGAKSMLITSESKGFEWI